MNIGIKGDANLQQLNKHVHGVREIHVDSWKYKNGFTRGVAQYGKGAAGPLLQLYVSIVYLYLVAVYGGQNWQITNLLVVYIYIY